MVDTRNYPIDESVFYGFCFVLFLLTAALSGYFLFASLREGLEDLAWMSVISLVVATVLAALFWWLL